MRILFYGLLFFSLGIAGAQPLSRRVDLSDELRAFMDISLLPAYRSGTIEGEVSSYDRSGGNDDGFSGKYSYLRRNADGSLVMFDVKGPGVLNRIWTPTPTTDTLDFFIDDTVRPALSICYLDLFSGKVFPFVAPLCDHQAGGYYWYFPILFQQRCLIVDRGKRLQFHQEGYRVFPAGTRVVSFSPVLHREEKQLLEKIALFWGRSPRRVRDYYQGGAKTAIADICLRPGETKNIFSVKTGGRILGIELASPAAFSDTMNPVFLRMNWDGDPAAAVNCPVANFFGYAFGQPSMRGLLQGADSGKAYTYFPMPFDRSASIDLVYKGTGAPVHCRAVITYCMKKRNAEKEGRFYAVWRRDSLTVRDPYHVFLDVGGRGHYVGTILQAQGLEKDGTPFWEGDDTLATDGVFRMHGTGSEDYFNGGWYAVRGMWDTTRSMPLSGCLLYSGAVARTGGYRFFLSDKVPFEKNIFHGIEHGGTAESGRPVVYNSVSFYYGDEVHKIVVLSERLGP